VVSDPANPSGPPTRDDRLHSLRRKLLKLNRAAIPDAPPAREPAVALPPAPELPPGSIVYRRDLPRVAPPRVPEGGGICIPLETLVAGSEIQVRSGSLYLIERPVGTRGQESVSPTLPHTNVFSPEGERDSCPLVPGEPEPQAAELPSELARALEALSWEPWPDCVVGAVREPPLLSIPPEEVCFLDIETTGLATTPVFLIGTLVWREGGFLCRQFLARTYAEEASILAHFVDQTRRSPALITFNGKTFDLPYLRSRAAATGVPFSEPRRHLDLLHVSRRLFRDKLPDCKLQTLERCICRRSRGDDIPGHEIPRAYHDFVRTGDAREMAIIIRHNQLDLLTMAHLVTRIVQEHP
jgi:uncharacterized protein YprB with RNaseH-like and TPR domain